MARTIAIGDIHGCSEALRILLEHIAPVEDDTIVVLGDAVDRGPDTRAVVTKLLELQEQCTLHFIRGNHEEMMLQARDQPPGDAWMGFGGAETLASYGGSLDDVLPAHWAFFESALDYYATDTEVFVHASLQPQVALEDQDPIVLRWTRITGNEEPIDESHRVVCGHTPQLDGFPLIIPGWVGIDTWAYGAGFLTALEVESNTVYQAQQGGKYRTYNLSDIDI